MILCRQYNEPENHTDPDDGVDGRFGVYCTDAGFTNRKWPKEKECEKVPICKDLPKPCNTIRFICVFLVHMDNFLLFLILAPSLKYRPLKIDFVAENEFIYYECADPESVLDDNSGRNYFSLQCGEDGVLGVYDFPEVDLDALTDDSGSGCVLTLNHYPYIDLLTTQFPLLV